MEGEVIGPFPSLRLIVVIVVVVVVVFVAGVAFFFWRQSLKSGTIFVFCFLFFAYLFVWVENRLTYTEKGIVDCFLSQLSICLPFP